MRIFRRYYTRVFHSASRTLLAKSATAISIIALAAIATSCAPQIHSAATNIFKAGTSIGKTLANDHLVFVVEPADTANHAAIGPSIEVQFVNQAGQIDTTANSNITLTIGNNPSAGILSGTATAMAVNGVATFSGLSIDQIGTGYTFIASASVVGAAASTPFNITYGVANKVVFATQPVGAASNASLGSIAVRVEDAYGNAVANSVAPITLAIANNAGPGGTLSGTVSLNAVSGVATFSGLSINLVGTGYTLAASSSSLSGATSSAFNITSGAPTQLVFGTEPSNAQAGTSLGSITVKIEDAAGNLTSSTATVTLAIGSNPPGVSGTLSGTVSVSAVGGTATLSGLNINKAGAGYTLTASSGSLTGATSTSFNITVGAAAKLAFTTVPASAASAANFTVAVTVEDVGGNPVTSSNATVALAIGTNAGPGGTLSGTTSQNALSGVATFSSLQIDIAGVGYTLVATSGALTSATSVGFTITAGTATKLVITSEPINTVAGSSLGNISVQVEDAAGNVCTTYSSAITFAILNNPSSGTLSGTNPETPSSGVATFSNLSINYGGTGYTIQATSGSLTAATSTAFNLTYPLPTSFAWSGSTYIGAGQCIAYTVEAMNGSAPAAYGSGTVVTLTGAGSGAFYGSSDSSCASSSITTVTFNGGVNSQTVYYKDPTIGSLTFTATDASSHTGSYSVQVVGQYALTSATSSGSVGSIFQLTITLEDYAGNVITAPAGGISFGFWGTDYFSQFCGTSDPTCAAGAVGSVVVPSGSSSVTFYFKDNRAESANPGAGDQSGYFNGSPNNIWLNVSPNNITSGSLVVTGPTFITPGTCSTYTVTAADSYGNISPLTSAQTVSLSSTSGGSFYAGTDTSCSSGAVTSLSMAPSATTAVFHFLDNTSSDKPVLSAAASGFLSVNFTAQVVASIPPIVLDGSDATKCTIVNGDLKCWGDNSGDGMVGNNTDSYVNLPAQVIGMTSGVTKVQGSGQGGYVMAVADGGLYAWGSAGYGATGGGGGGWSPSQVPNFGPGSGITDIAAGASSGMNTCMVINGGVDCAGDSYYGPGGLGNGLAYGAGGTYVTVPDYPQGSGFTKVYGGFDQFCVIVGGGAQCWGRATISPTFMIPQGSGVTDISMRKYENFAILNGALYAFDFGGDFWPLNLTSGVTKISSGYEYSCALQSGVPWCWGYGGTPAQVSGVTGAIDVKADNNGACALLANSDLKCWGYNGAGGLGNGTITDAGSPVSSSAFYGGITRINQGAWGNLVVSGNIVTQSLGWTVAAGDFLVVQIGGPPGSTQVSAVTAYAGATAYPMTMGADVLGSRAEAGIFYLPNASGITSIQISYVSNNSQNISVAAAEYSGLSPTASAVGSSVGSDSGYVSNTSWSVGPYSAPAGSLVLAAVTDDAYGASESLSAGYGWSYVTSWGGGGGGNILLEEQLNTSGSMTATGSGSFTGYRYYDATIVSFK